MLVCLVENDELLFFKTGKGRKWNPLGEISIQKFISGEESVQVEITRTLKKSRLSVLIVPDYWIGNMIFTLPSKKKRIIETFLARKLRLELSGIPEISNFFSYRLFQDNDGRNGIYTTFLQEPAAYTLYEGLEKAGLTPERITSPALLWERKLSSALVDFESENAALLHVLKDECYQYFFNFGKFIFSRRIKFTEDPLNFEKNLEESVYELTQSMHLFIQKVKSSVTSLYLLMGSDLQPDYFDYFSNSFNEKIVYLNEYDSNPEIFQYLTRETGTETILALLPTGNALQTFGITHKMRERSRQWQSALNTGIAVGAALIILLGMEQFQLRQSEAALMLNPPGSGMLSFEQGNEILSEFAKNSDEVIARNKMWEPAALLETISEIIPDAAWLNEVEIDFDVPGSVMLRGTIEVPDIDSLDSSLSLFLGKLKEKFPGSRDLNLEDLRIAPPEKAENVYSRDGKLKGFDIEMEFDLN